MTIRTWAPNWRNPPNTEEGWRRAYLRSFLFGSMGRDKLTEYHQANPNGKAGPYTLGPYFSDDNRPESWYAHDVDGRRITVNGFGKMRLMEPSNPEAVKFLVDWAVKKAAGYDCLFTDSVGSAPAAAPLHAEREEILNGHRLGRSSKSYISSVPVNPKTKKPYTRDEWMAAMVKFLDAVGAAFPLAYANGLQNAKNFPETQVLLNSVNTDGFIAELWLRRPQDKVDFWPTPTQWDAEAAMIPATRAKGKDFLGWVKVWPTDGTVPTADYIARFSRMVAATVLLGGDDRTFVNFMPNKQVVSSSWVFDADLEALGAPTGPMTSSGLIRQRRFGNKMLSLDLATYKVTLTTVVPPPGAPQLTARLDVTVDVECPGATELVVAKNDGTPAPAPVGTVHLGDAVPGDTFSIHGRNDGGDGPTARLTV